MLEEPSPPAAEESQPDLAPGSVPWRARDIVFGILAGFGGAIVFFVLYGIVLGIADSDPLSQIGEFVFASVVMYGFLLLGVWNFAIRRNDARFRDAGFANLAWGSVALMLPVTFGVIFANLLVQEGIQAAFGEIRTASDQLGVGEGGIDAAEAGLLLITTSVAAPVVEEFVFRGLLYRYLRARRGIPTAMVVSAALFSLGHFIPLLMPSLFLLGLALAWVAQRYDSLYPAIALHAFFNAIATIALASAT
jgi:membrane protease YdiL (CAAX protease family)